MQRLVWQIVRRAFRPFHQHGAILQRLAEAEFIQFTRATFRR